MTATCWKNTDYNEVINTKFRDQLDHIENALGFKLWRDVSHDSGNVKVLAGCIPGGADAIIKLSFHCGNPTTPGVCPEPKYISEIEIELIVHGNRTGKKVERLSVYSRGAHELGDGAFVLFDFRPAATAVGAAWAERHYNVLKFGIPLFQKLGIERGAAELQQEFNTFWHGTGAWSDHGIG